MLLNLLFKNKVNFKAVQLINRQDLLNHIPKIKDDSNAIVLGNLDKLPIDNVQFSYLKKIYPKHDEEPFRYLEYIIKWFLDNRLISSNQASYLLGAKLTPYAKYAIGLLGYQHLSIIKTDYSKLLVYTFKQAKELAIKQVEFMDKVNHSIIINRDNKSTYLISSLLKDHQALISLFLAGNQLGVHIQSPSSGMVANLTNQLMDDEAFINNEESLMFISDDNIHSLVAGIKQIIQ